MAKPKEEIVSLNNDILAALSIEELEDRLELQIVGVLELTQFLDCGCDTCATCNTCYSCNTNVNPIPIEGAS
jgi:hypothetical protein